MNFQGVRGRRQVGGGRRWRGAAGGVAGLIALVALSGCSADSLQSRGDTLQASGGRLVGAVRPLAIVDAVSLINTDKTIIDHVASSMMGEDCSMLRSMDGGHYCQPRYENKPVVPSLYCYRTLGDVTCYDRPSTNASDTLVGVRPGGPLPTY